MARRTGPDPKTVELVRDRAGGLCEVCGWAECQQLHHRKPRRMGGTKAPEINSPANLIFICHPCHARIESHRAKALEDGHIVRGGGDPVSIPAFLRGTWKLLEEDGSAIQWQKMTGSMADSR